MAAESVFLRTLGVVEHSKPQGARVVFVTGQVVRTSKWFLPRRIIKNEANVHVKIAWRNKPIPCGQLAFGYLNLQKRGLPLEDRNLNNETNTNTTTTVLVPCVHF